SAAMEKMFEFSRYDRKCVRLPPISCPRWTSMIRVDGTELKGLSPQQTAALVQRRLNRRDDDSDDWMPASRLPTIAALDSLLPVGLPRGAVVRYDGSLAILLGMLA